MSYKYKTPNRKRFGVLSAVKENLELVAKSS